MSYLPYLPSAPLDFILVGAYLEFQRLFYTETICIKILQENVHCVRVCELFLFAVIRFIYKGKPFYGQFLNMAPPDIYFHVHDPNFSVVPDIIIMTRKSLVAVCCVMHTEKGPRVFSIRNDPIKLLISATEHPRIPWHAPICVYFYHHGFVTVWP